MKIVENCMTFLKIPTTLSSGKGNDVDRTQNHRERRDRKRTKWRECERERGNIARGRVGEIIASA